MNEHTEKLIRELADKLGTTTEYLWGVLIVQAKLSAIMSITTMIGSLVIPVVFYLIMKWACKADGDPDNKSFPTSGFIVGFLVMVIIWSACELLPNMLSGFFNPEYWALKQILP